MPRGQGTGMGRTRDISDILQGQTLGGAFGMNTRKRNGGSFFDVEPNLLRPPTVKQSVPNFSEVPDISNILNRQIDPQVPGDAIMPGADIPSFGPGTMLGDFNDGTLLQIDSSVDQQAGFDVPEPLPGPSSTGMPQHIQDIIDNFPREMPQSVRDAITKDLLNNVTGTDSGLPDGTVLSPEPVEPWQDQFDDTVPWPGDPAPPPVQYRAEPLELQEFTFSDALTLPPEYVSPDLKALPEFYGMEYDPYVRAPTLTSVDDVVNMERPAGISDEDWQGYKQNQFNARVGSAESKTFDQWKYGFGDVRGRTQDLQEPAIRSLERSVRRSLGGAIENPNVRRQTERATLGGFGMGLEDVSGASRGQALSEYGADFRRAFETKERNYITALQQIGGENIATLQESQINYDRATKTYWQDEQRRYDVEYANWLAENQEYIANWYAQEAADIQEAGTVTVVRTEGG